MTNFVIDVYFVMAKHKLDFYKLFFYTKQKLRLVITKGGGSLGTFVFPFRLSEIRFNWSVYTYIILFINYYYV